jgi:hypothetical protein
VVNVGAGLVPAHTVNVIASEAWQSPVLVIGILGFDIV